jgi:hypothetical protein
VLGRRRRGVEGEERAVAAMAFRVGPRDLFGQSANDVRNEVLRFLSPAERGRLAAVGPQMRSDVGRVNAFAGERDALTQAEINGRTRLELEAACRVPTPPLAGTTYVNSRHRAESIERVLTRAAANPLVTELRFPVSADVPLSSASIRLVEEMAPRLTYLSLGRVLRSTTRKTVYTPFNATMPGIWSVTRSMVRMTSLRTLRIPHLPFSGDFYQIKDAVRNTLEVVEVSTMEVCHLLDSCPHLHTVIIRAHPRDNEPWQMLERSPSIRHLTLLMRSEPQSYLDFSLDTYDVVRRVGRTHVITIESLTLVPAPGAPMTAYTKARTYNALRKIVRNTPTLRRLHIHPNEPLEGARMRAWAARDEPV